MKSNYDTIIDALLKSEGGYVNNPADSGGPTNMGITQATLASWRGHRVSIKDVQNLQVSEAKSIYKARYWDTIQGDLLPSGLDYAVFDYGVVSGPQKAVMSLQEIVGTADDGRVGNITLAAVANFGEGLPALIDRYQDNRIAFYKRLSNWPVFGNGWTKRVESVRVQAQEFAKSAESAVPSNAAPKTDAQPTARVVGNIVWQIILALVGVILK